MADPYMSEIKMISWNYAPKDWAFCNGQLLAIAQNQALFSLLGTTYGGNGTTTFALPDLRGRVPLHAMDAQGFALGQVAGEASHTLTVQEIPLHTHTIGVDGTTPAASNTNVASSNTVLGQATGVQASGGETALLPYASASPASALAPANFSATGNSQPHQNMQPFQVINYIIALSGVFPSRN